MRPRERDQWPVERRKERRERGRGEEKEKEEGRKERERGDHMSIFIYKCLLSNYIITQGTVNKNDKHYSTKFTKLQNYKHYKIYFVGAKFYVNSCNSCLCGNNNCQFRKCRLTTTFPLNLSTITIVDEFKFNVFVNLHS